MENKLELNGTEQFDKAKVKNLYESVHTYYDNETGEIIEMSSDIIRTATKEPDFIKIYYNSIMAFNGINNIPSDVLIAFCNFLTYANSKDVPAEINFNKRTKELLSEMTKLSTSQLNRYMNKMCEVGIFFKTEYRGIYVANPYLIARGEWKNIKDLRGEFDFKNGKWSFKKTYSKEEKTVTEELPNAEKHSA